MGKKKTFILGTEWAEQMLGVPDEDFTAVVRAVFEYAVYGSHEEVSGLAKILVKQMADFIDDNTEKYNDVCQKRKEAVEKRWANAKQENTNEYKCIQKNTNVYKSIHKNYDNMIYDNDNDKENKTFIPSEKGLKEKDAYASQKEVVEKIVERWNQLPDCVPKVKAIDMAAERFKMLKERLKTYTLDGILSAIDNIENSPFLLGDNKNRWTIKFDWFVRPNNFPKVYEGQYCDNGVTITTQRVARGISIVDEMIARGELPNDD